MGRCVQADNWLVCAKTLRLEATRPVPGTESRPGGPEPKREGRGWCGEEARLHPGSSGHFLNTHSELFEKKKKKIHIQDFINARFGMFK